MTRGPRVALATISAMLLTTAGAQAAQLTGVPTNDTGAQSLAAAMTDAGTTVGSASFEAVAPVGEPAPNATGTGTLGPAFPSQNRTRFAALTTGSWRSVDRTTPGWVTPGSGTQLGYSVPARGVSGTKTLANDATILKVPVTVPATANCLTFDFQLLSSEYPTYVGKQFNDAFVAELDQSTWKLTAAASRVDVEAPDNFAFDSTGKAITVNTTTFSKANAAGTGYADYGATPLLAASKAVTPGVHTLFLSIFDSYDQIYDSAVLLDALRVGFVPNPGVNCKAGAQPVLYSLQADGGTTQYVDTAQTFTATVKDSQGAVVKDGDVKWTVAGANATTMTTKTNASGVATFTYTGNAPGTDSIAACYDNDGDGSCEANASRTAVYQARPRVTIGSPAPVVEGDAGTTPVALPVTLDKAATGPVTVDWSTADGSATAGADYTASTGKLTIPAGETSATIEVPVLGDQLVEGDETFDVALSNPATAVLGTPAKASVTIADDDQPAAAPQQAVQGQTASSEPNAIVLCGQDIVLLDVVGASRQVRVAGLADQRFAGQRITIAAGGKTVGSTRAKSDGTFAAAVSLPRKALRSSIRYTATVAGKRSRALKLERRLVITKRQGLTVSGRIAASAKDLPKRVTFYRQLTCTQRKQFATAKVSKRGTFSVRLAKPQAGERYALFRVSAKLGDRSTYTLPIAVR